MESIQIMRSLAGCSGLVYNLIRVANVAIDFPFSFNRIFEKNRDSWGEKSVEHWNADAHHSFS